MYHIGSPGTGLPLLKVGGAAGGVELVCEDEGVELPVTLNGPELSVAAFLAACALLCALVLNMQQQQSAAVSSQHVAHLRFSWSASLFVTKKAWNVGCLSAIIESATHGRMSLPDCPRKCP
jgi:hypothetical protein